MFLTRQGPYSSSPQHDSGLPRHRKPNPTDFPTAQLTLLALVRVAEPIALTSIQPYAWKLVLSFNVCEKNEASFYSGLLVAAFALAESLTGMLWGGLSDKVGRKPILLFGCCGTILSLLLVGFSTSFWMALCGRALGGLLNGNIGVVQTMVGELVTVPEHEPRAYAVMPFVWSIGTIIGPAIGGYFSQPAENFPSLFKPDGLFGRYPFLLPNLLCAALLLVGIIAGFFLIQETHPGMLQQGNLPQDSYYFPNSETPVLATASATNNAPADLRNESYGTFNSVSVGVDEPYQFSRRPSSTSSSSASYSKAFTRPVIMLVIALGIFTYHCMTYDILLPIYFQDERSWAHSKSTTDPMFSGGLGIPLQEVGVIMSVNGVIALFIQGVIFPAMAAYFGVWKLFILVTVFHPVAYLIVPFLPSIPDQSSFLLPAIYSCLTIRNIFSILAYPVLLILIKEASPSPRHLGKINGLAASTGAACRTIASPVAGYLYSVGSSIDCTALAWWSSGIVAVIGGIQALIIQRPKSSQSQITTVRDMRHFGEMETREYATRRDMEYKKDFSLSC